MSDRTISEPQHGIRTDLELPDDSPRLVTEGNEEDEVWSSFSIQNWTSLTADSGDQNASGQVGFWMHSWASLASNGLISGHTRTWSTLGVKGFHGSVLLVVLDASGQVIWPSDPDHQKHTYGVDGFLSPFSPHDRTDYWANKPIVMLHGVTRHADVVDNGHTDRYGAAIRVLLEIYSEELDGDLTLPVAAAKAQLGAVSASAQLLVHGYVGDLAQELPSWQSFDVNSYADYLKAVSAVQRQVLQDTADIRRPGRPG